MTDSLSMQDKVVVITGGASGIGRAAAIGMAKLGARVLVTGRRTHILETVAAEHPNLAALAADVAAPEDAARTIAHATALWGQMDVLVNNAGAGAILPLVEATPDRISQIFAVNVLGPSLLAAAAVPHLAKTQGTIINISSTFGHKAAAGLSHYAASKAALEHLTRCWALELAPQRIRVNAIAAGPTESGALTGMMGLSAEQAAAIEAAERERIPLQRRGQPDDIARWIIQAANPASEWLTGQVITVDGGLALT